MFKTIISIWFSTLVLLTLTCCAGPSTVNADDQPKSQTHVRPNILILLADDLGYSDLGCYGGEIRTPHIDALAAGGLKFTQFYNSSRCCPSRASLLTGLYPHQAGIGRFVGGGKLPGYRGHLTDRCVTLAQVLKSAGYGTYACGKWHVNEPGPIERGFDEFYGFVHGYAVDSWDPTMMIRLSGASGVTGSLPASATTVSATLRETHDQNTGKQVASATQITGTPRTCKPGEYYATNAITDHALDFLEIARRKDRPWLLYVAYQAAHFPVQAPPRITATYVQTYRQGWDVIRRQRLEKMKQLGLIDPAIDLPPREMIDNVKVAGRLGSMTEDGRNPAWDSLPTDRRADLAQRMAVYAAMVQTMDTNIGRIIASLREHNQLDNTLILFISDNGACAEWEPFGFDLDPADYRNHPPGHGVNGGTPGKPNVLHTGEALAAMGGPGSMFSYGCGWANASNTPLRLYKHYAHEGGIRTPMIAHWPAGITDRGKLRQHVGHVMDVMATCVDLADAKYPATFDGHTILPMAGRSLRSAFTDEPDQPRTLLFEHEHNAALRQGDWKLVASNVIVKAGLRPGVKWELYNLKEDPTEQHDLADRYPQRVEAMSELFLEQARKTLILPAP